MSSTLLTKRLVQEIKRRSIETVHFPLDEFVIRTFPNYDMNWHHVQVIRKLEQLRTGAIKRLIISMPPRHGKSELCSVRFPAYMLGLNPNELIIACSYSATLANNMGRKVKRVMGETSYKRLFPNVRLATKSDVNQINTAREFEVSGYDGKYIGSGVGGGITGEGMTLGVIDDPIKNRKEANSRTYQESIFEWYKSVFRTRLHKDGRILITVTRWHEDDLVGKIIETSKEDWDIVNIPAMCDSEVVKGIDDPRSKGEALWESHFPMETLLELQESLGLFDFNALYQGDPTSDDSAIFNPGYWQYYNGDIADKLNTEESTINYVIQSWDTALKDGEENDYSVCTTWGVANNGVYLLHRFKERLQYPDLKQAMIMLNDSWRPKSVLIEDKVSGISVRQELHRTTKMPLLPIEPKGDKIVRAKAVTGFLAAGKVFLPTHATWLQDYMDELRRFPSGKHDDQVDSTTQFLQYMLFSERPSTINMSGFMR